MNLYERFCATGKKLAVLVDPDKPTDSQIVTLAEQSMQCGVDFFFVGGSLLTNNNLDSCVKLLKAHATFR